MILHLAPDYINKPLYHHLLEALATYDIAQEQYVYACDNAAHQAPAVPDNVHVVKRSFSVLERLLFFPKQRYLLQDIESIVPFNRVQLIHAHTLFSSGYMAYRLHRKYGIPYIVAVRNTDVNVFFKHMPHLRHIGRRIAAHAEKIVFISPAYQKQVIGTYLPRELESKAIVIPNGIDPLFLANTSHHSLSDEIRLIYVGRVEKAKNVHTIIEVVDRLINKGQKVSLCMVGQIIDNEYGKIISERPYITWYNQCPKEEVLGHLRQNDIFIMPSYHETFGLVYAEAMSQGLPILYTKGQGFDGFFADGHVGYSVPSEDVDYIIQRIMDIIREYETLSRHCIESVHTFDWQQIASSYNNIYQNTIHGNC